MFVYDVIINNNHKTCHSKQRRAVVVKCVNQYMFMEREGAGM